jgi:RHS repeat-associated protein
VATDRTGNQSYFLYDGLGSTANLSDGNGNVTATYSYDVFGELRPASSPGNEWLFTGEQRDRQGSRNFYYLRARYYDPAIGRFLGPDSVPSGNLYAYVGGNPVNLVDPSGLCPWCSIENPFEVLRDFFCRVGCDFSEYKPIVESYEFTYQNPLTVTLTAIQVVDLFPIPGQWGVAVELAAFGASLYQMWTNDCVSEAEKWTLSGNAALNAGIGELGNFGVNPYVIAYEVGSFLSSNADLSRCALTGALNGPSALPRTGGRPGRRTGKE